MDVREPELIPIAGALLRWHGSHGRDHLPWRADPSPFRVVVSEFMLQQTQVDRVVPAFERFVRDFPDFASLAAASARDVIAAWRGLGYNSRAVRLHALARAVCERHGGILPCDEASLRALTGIGPYTARAILAFAFRKDTVAVDTNVRRVVARTNFGVARAEDVAARSLDAAAQRLVPAGRAFEFNSALMDLGASLCTARSPKCSVCPLHRQCRVAPLDSAALAALPVALKKKKTERFEDSTRYLRGRIVDHLRALPAHTGVSLLVLYETLKPALSVHGPDDVELAVTALAGDGLLVCERDSISLPQ